MIASSHHLFYFASQYFSFALLTEGATVVWTSWTVVF